VIQLAQSEADIARCFAVMQELRPHLKEAEFVARIQRQQASGYLLLALIHEEEVRAVAGYRISENLAWERFLYVDDLVARNSDQGSGYGSRLIDWLIAEARAQGCAQFHLDSGVQRFQAHRFYLHKGLDITSHHFALVL
jgi:GNAT superfamily N-acetyltransferase